jgi:uncharacterized protein YqiB (DUF1249 family)
VQLGVKQKYRFDIKRMSADCEANYVRLCRLLPEIAALSQCARTLADPSQATQGFKQLQRVLEIDLPSSQLGELSISVNEQCRYTTTLAVTVHIHGLAVPDDSARGGVKMLVRLYHDVRLAEVIAFSGKHSKLASYEYPNEVMFQPDEKEQQNRFLAEWLGLGLIHGLASHDDSHNAAAFYGKS